MRPPPTCAATSNRLGGGSVRRFVPLALVVSAFLVLAPTALAADELTITQADVTAEADTPTGATAVSFSPVITYTDGTPGTPDATLDCTPASGSSFSLGSTPVSCTATGQNADSGKSGSTSFHVIVQDTSFPVITVPSHITTSATGPSGATVDYSVSATDPNDGAITPSCSPSSGSTFPVGTTTVSCSASDPIPNTASASFSVTVNPTSLPGTPLDTTVEATGPSGAAFSYGTPDGADCSPPSGSTFHFGTTTVSCSVGNFEQGSFNVTVRDTTPPAISVPAPVTAGATGPGGAAVSYNVSASDLVDGSEGVQCSPASGSTFPLGATTVTCTSTDQRGNSATASFTVSVKDQTPPQITGVVNVTVSAKAGAPSAKVAYPLPQATDLVDGTVRVACSPAPGALFPVGITIVSCQATDAAGNSSGVTVRITVKGIKVKSLLTPAGGARLIGPPLLRWPVGARATYYNVQIWVTTKSGPKKVYSNWPKTNRLQLTKSWSFEGHTYRLDKGVYRWYVWPGYGPLARARYGGLIGTSTFSITR
jgi:hypothetical protein